jgi:DNA-binding winged helix-turn-helix (wHTH) protein
MVYGPDDELMTEEDLPQGPFIRWTPRRKAKVVAAVIGGLVSKAEVCERYGLSEAELERWLLLAETNGLDALKVTRQDPVERELCKSLPGIITGDRLEVGDMYLDRKTGWLYGGGASVYLQMRRSQVLVLLGERLGETVTREVIYDHLYPKRKSARGRDAPAIKVLDRFISYTRRLLAQVSIKVEIETVWGRGYRLVVRP